MSKKSNGRTLRIPIEQKFLGKPNLKFLFKERKQLISQKAQIERKLSSVKLPNQINDLKAEIVCLKKEIDKLSIIIERMNDIDRIADIKQIQRYQTLPQNIKTDEYISHHTKNLHNKLSAPDEVWCSDGKVRTKKDMEAWRILKRHIKNYPLHKKIV